jgi:cell division septation protein DedD
LAQDDYYYEIQLTNKQLVFYFLAGATGLILSFLAGVMVGRGVDQSAGEVQAARPAAEERVVTEETPKPVPPAEDLTYAQRLESDKADEGLERAKAGAPAGKGAPAGSARAGAGATAPAGAAAAPATSMAAAPATTAAARPAPPSTNAPAATATTTPPRGTPAVKPVAPAVKPAKGGPAAGSGNFTIQVGAFKDKATADSVVARLKAKGFAAYVLAPEGEGLFNVRVGNFPGRADAERIQGRLRDEEKFKPFIVKP